MDNKRALVAAIAWTALVSLALVRVAFGVNDLVIFALIFSNIAVLFTGWLIAEHIIRRATDGAVYDLCRYDDETVERVAAKMAEALRDSSNVTRL